MFSRRLGVVAALCACLYQPAWAAEDARAYLDKGVADAAERQALIEEGRKAAFFCFNCHGDSGNSRIPQVPNLAGQHPVYILDQIGYFLSGKRQDAFMQGLMKVLSEREKAAVALYFSNASGQPAVPTPGARAEEGKQAYAKFCARCHLDNADGGESFPRLAGQQPDYLRNSLTRYLTMSGERFYPPMTNAVSQLGEKNIDAIVDYLSSLK